MVQEAVAEPTTVTPVEPTAEPTTEPTPGISGAETVEPAADEGTPPSPKPAWAEVTDASDLLDHPEVKSVYEKRLARHRDEIARQAADDLKAATARWEGSTFHRNLEGVIGNLDEKLRSLEAEPADVAKAAAQIAKLRESLDEGYTASLKEQGFNDAAKQYDQAILGAVMQRLDEKGKDNFDDTLKGAKTYGDVLDYLVDRKTQPQKAEIEKLKLEIEKMKKDTREGQSPNLAEGSSGGGRRYSDMTFEERAALSDAQRDALIAQER